MPHYARHFCRVTLRRLRFPAWAAPLILIAMCPWPAAACGLGRTAADPAAADNTPFLFHVPPMPGPPEIVRTWTTTDGQFISVFAEFKTHEQTEPRCDREDPDNCAPGDWYAVPSKAVSPNPPDITLARVYYHVNDEYDKSAFADMAYDADYAAWRAAIPGKIIPTGAALVYYLAAADSAGNAVSELPAPGQDPCPDSGNARTPVPELFTPALNSCDSATARDQCGVLLAGAPIRCGGIPATVTDPRDDLCLEPDSNGIQQLAPPGKDYRMDLHGFSAAANRNTISLSMLPNGSPGPIVDCGAFESYVFFIYNPDTADPDPDDGHVTNAYALTFTPLAIGSDPGLVRVLWNLDCATDPATTDPYACRLAAPLQNNGNPAFAYAGGAVFACADRSGAGEILAGNYSLVGAQSDSAIITAYTNGVYLGITRAWTMDRTPSLRLVARNHVVRTCGLGCGGATLAVSTCRDYAARAGCAPVTTVDAAGRTLGARAGLEVWLETSQGVRIGDATVTDEQGNFFIAVPVGAVTDSEQPLRTVARIPAAQCSGVPCNSKDSGGACLVVLDAEIRLAASGATRTVSPALPAPGGGRKEIGNLNCDDAVDVADVILLRQAYGASLGDAGYRTWADLNSDGVVDISDFLIIKQNYGKTLDAAPSFDPAACK